MFRLHDIIPPGAIIPALTANDREGVIRELVGALTRAGGIPAHLEGAVMQGVLDRERRTSTGFGCGVAVPHAKHASLTQMGAAIGISARGIDFSSLDRQPVYCVFLLVSPDDKPEDHLGAMDAIFRHHVSKESFRRSLRHAQTEQQVRDLLDASDAHRLHA